MNVDANCLYVYALRCVNVYVCTYVRKKNDEEKGTTMFCNVLVFCCRRLSMPSPWKKG